MYSQIFVVSVVYMCVCVCVCVCNHSSKLCLPVPLADKKHAGTAKSALSSLFTNSQDLSQGTHFCPRSLPSLKSPKSRHISGHPQTSFHQISGLSKGALHGLTHHKVSNEPSLFTIIQGTPKRWEVVASYVRTRTLEEVVFMVKEKQGMSAGRMNKQVCVYLWVWVCACVCAHSLWYF